MIEYDKAYQLIHEYATELNSEQVSIADSIGRVAKATVTTSEALPGFNNSAMDGFALNSKASLAQGTSALIPVIDSMAAGIAHCVSKEAAGALEIMTGAYVPDEFDTVVPIEKVEHDESVDGHNRNIRLTESIKANQNIRLAGEDYKAQDIVVNANEMIRSEHIMALAACGLSLIDVYKKPRIDLITTGSELVKHTQENLALGQIRNSNGPYLQQKLTELGAVVQYHGFVEDKPELLLHLLEDLTAVDSDVDMVVTTGAVSVGRYDFIPYVLDRIGAEVIFHKVAIRPGKPILFARLPNNKFFLGLPGNPSAAAVGARFFIAPWLRSVCGLDKEKPYMAKLKTDTESNPRFHFFKKASLYCQGSSLFVDVLTRQQSFRIKPMVLANGWAVFPQGKASYSEGEEVAFYQQNFNIF